MHTTEWIKLKKLTVPHAGDIVRPPELYQEFYTWISKKINAYTHNKSFIQIFIAALISFTWIFIGSLLIIVPNWPEPRCPSTEEWLSMADSYG